MLPKIGELWDIKIPGDRYKPVSNMTMQGFYERENKHCFVLILDENVFAESIDNHVYYECLFENGKVHLVPERTFKKSGKKI